MLEPLFEWIGKETTARGVFVKEQLPEAIAKLQHGVEEERAEAKRLAAKSAPTPKKINTGMKKMTVTAMQRKRK